MQKEYITISEDRLHHILGVARKCYEVAKKRGHGESFARKMWMLGWLHDTGYEFSTEKCEHPHESAELMALVGINPSSEAYNAVKHHGLYADKKTEEYIILNIADMTVDSKGNDVGVMARLEDIKDRFGEWSDEYETACDVAYDIGLTAVNLAGVSV